LKAYQWEPLPQVSYQKYFLQYIEHTNIINILSKFHTESYSRYVDDILLIYNKTRTNIQEVLGEFNKIHHNLQFTLEQENDNTIIFLDISILRKDVKLKFNIYRKPTSSSIVIHASSCHPIEHKKMAFNYLLNRTKKYPLFLENKKAELNGVKQMARENGYNDSILNQKQYKKRDTSLMGNSSTVNIQRDKKWVSFTYIGKETRHIMKLFKNTEVKTAFRTNNTIKRILKPKPQI
jgi:hypothetical protein